MNQELISELLAGNNNPENGSICFDSSDHVRFQNGDDIISNCY